LSTPSSERSAIWASISLGRNAPVAAPPSGAVMLSTTRTLKPSPNISRPIPCIRISARAVLGETGRHMGGHAS